MATLTLRNTKGSALTHTEVDDNFSNLNDELVTSTINTQDTNYTLVLTDAGKTIYHSASDTAARTYTIPLNSSVDFENGTLIKIINLDDDDVTIVADSTAVLYWLDGTDSAVADANRTLGRRGSCVIQQISTDVWTIEGNAGLT